MFPCLMNASVLAVMSSAVPVTMRIHVLVLMTTAQHPLVIVMTLMIPLIKCAIYLKCEVTYYRPAWPAMVAPILLYFFDRYCFIA